MNTRVSSTRPSAPTAPCGPTTSALVKRLAELTPTELALRARLRDEAFRTAGHHVHCLRRGREGIERTFPMDLLPRLIPAEEWAHIEAGLIQRVTALNLFLDDLYVGERAAINDGIVPKWLVISPSGFSREAFGLPVPKGARCLVAGIDLVRDAEGTYRVLEDNLRSPSGISYVLENRAAMTRVLPTRFRTTACAAWTTTATCSSTRCDMSHRRLPARTPRSSSSRLAFSTAPTSSTRSWRDRWASSSSKDAISSWKTTSCRCAPRTDSSASTSSTAASTTSSSTRSCSAPTRSLGVPGLMAAARAGNVTLANAVGNGVADDKAVYAFVPELIRYYLGDDPILPNVDTYLLWDEDHRAAVLDRIDELVIKPVAESGGYGMLMPGSSEREIDDDARQHRQTHRATTSHKRSCRCRGTRHWSTTTSKAATSTCGHSCCRARPSK